MKNKKNLRVKNNLKMELLLFPGTPKLIICKFGRILKCDLIKIFVDDLLKASNSLGGEAVQAHI